MLVCFDFNGLSTDSLERCTTRCFTLGNSIIKVIKNMNIGDEA